MRVINAIKHYKNNPYIIPGSTLVLIMGVLHFIFPVILDDIWLLETVKTMGFGEIMSIRYNYWTSRVVIDGVMFMFSRNWHVFLIANLIIFVLLYVFSVKTFVDQPSIKECWFCVFMVLIFPFESFSSVGLLGTSLNYLWPLATAVIFGYSLKKVVSDSGRIRSWEYPLYILALLFASNMETVGVLLLGTTVTLMINRLLGKKELSVYLLLSIVITAGMTVFALIAPGNEHRRVAEMHLMPNFMMFSPIEQIQIGYGYAVGNIVVGLNIIFPVFSLLLFVAVWLQHKEKNLRIIAFVPVCASLLFGGISIIQQWVFLPGINEVLVYGFNLNHLVRVANYNHVFSYVSLMLSGVILVFVLTSIHIGFYEELKTAWFYNVLFVLGLATAVAMGFSPTIYVSGHRTHTFAIYVLVLLSLVFYQRVREWGFKYEKWMFWGIGLLGLGIGSLRVILRVVPFLS